MFSASLFCLTCSGTSTQQLLDLQGLAIDRSPPKIISPLSGTKIATSATVLSWESRLAASSYTIEVARDLAFTQPMAGSPFKSEKTFLSVNFDDAYSYYWRVRANTTRAGEYSEPGLVHVMGGAVRVYCPQATVTCSNAGKIGNKSSPYELIGPALTQAAGLGLPVHVAARGGAAVYAGTITLIEGVSLLGGYSGVDWSRNISANPTELYSENKYAVYSGNSLATTTAYQLDGFTIRLVVAVNVGSGLDRQAIRLEFARAPLTISNNSIYFSSSVSICDTTGRAIYLTDSSAILQDNTIYDSAGIGCFTGMWGEALIEMASSNPVIRRNRLVSQKSANSSQTAIVMNAKSSPVIQENRLENVRSGIFLTGYSRPVILGNTIQLGTFTGLNTVGMSFSLNNPNAIIAGNRIFSGSATTTTPWSISGATGTAFKIFNNTIQVASSGTSIAVASYSGIYFLNNILFTSAGTTRRCFSESGAGFNPSVFLHNNLFDCANALYYDAGTTAHTVIADVNDASLTTQGAASTAAGNVSFANTGNQLFVDIDGADNNYATIADNDWSLRTGATGVINGGVSCPSGFATATHDWNDSFGSPESNQAGCDEKYPYTKSTYSAGFCRTTYLYPAIEIAGDNIGNDNGLCEAGETCLMNPNMGAYAGHGSLINAGCDVSGLISGVTLLRYADNGY